MAGGVEVVKTHIFPPDHPNPKKRGAQIVAFEGDEIFMKALQKFPRDYPFTVRAGGKVYIRGGDRFEPGNPNAFEIPMLSKRARSKFICGSKKDILAQGEQAEDSARAEAQQRGEADNWDKTVIINVHKCMHMTKYYANCPCDYFS